MKLHSQFLRLHARYGDNDEIFVTMDELAVTFDCTHRNALTIINRMAQMGWIRWTPQRGRGRRSTLEFLTRPEEIAVQSMMQAINRRDIQRAMDQLQSHSPSASLQERLQGWFMTYFGRHSEVRSNKQIDMLRLPIRQQLHTVDPLYMNLLAESFVSSHIFDGLVRKSNTTGGLVPGIAHAWETDASRKLYTFYLRKEVLFHNGKMLTAYDVVYTFERLMQTSQRMLYSAIFKQLQSVRALHPYMVTMELKEPNELFLPFLCTSRAAIVPRDLDQLGDKQFGQRPIGSGPFQLREMNDNLCVLEVFKHYYQERAHLDRVEIVHVPWQMTDSPTGGVDTGIDMEVGSNEPLSPFHVIHNPAVRDSAAWSQIHSDVSVRKFVTFNTKKTGPLSDPAIRAAIWNCLERGTMTAEKVVSEKAVETEKAGKTAKSTNASKKAAQRSAAPPSNTKGQALEPLRIATINHYKADAEQVAASLQACGYACQVVSSSAEEFKGPIRLEADLIVFSLIRDRDEQLRLYDLYSTISEHVEPHTRTDIRSRLEAIIREPDAAARDIGFRTIEELLMKEHQLYILYEHPVQTAFLPSLRGVTFNSQGWVDLRRVWFPPEA